ncbi:MAG: peptidylprolyl isomerase [Bacteroidetes bacterium]|nr:peptidylprolyl isomerase [Bacteroidota bacterium]
MRAKGAKFFIVSIMACAMSLNSHAQTLFSYGNNAVSKEEFLKAYSKNNSHDKPTDKSYNDYLALYIRYKLKVKAAYDLHLDTLSGQHAELKNFRNQVADSYMADQESLDRLVEEAFNRSRKDIHLAHIFISIPKNASPADTLKAYEKAMIAYEALKKNKDFGEAAALYSDDPAAKENHGDIGYITVFTLPYELETLAYNTSPNHFSKLYRSQAGYHIFKNLGERKGVGKISAAHILLAFAPNADDASKAKTKAKADSIYHALLNGADFKELAQKYSADNLTYQNAGLLPDFGVGKYEPAFEEAAFALNKDGAISKPVATQFGYHIIKRLARKELPEKNKETMDWLKQRVMADPRIAISTNKFLSKIYTLCHFKSNDVNRPHLWAYTDSSLQMRKIPQFPNLDYQTPLFSFGKKAFVVKDWLDFARMAKSKPAISAGKNDEQLFESFTESSALAYYREHLEDYNKEFAYQLTEFKEGNLLFEVMQRKVWDKALIDSSGLREYYNAHKEKYQWSPSADALIFTCNNEKSAENIKTKLQVDISNWRKWVENAGSSVQGDSGRFEMAQLPMADNKFIPGQFTSFNITPPDNTVTFAYIVQLYNQPSQRSFTEARGFVMNDYQTYVEDKWIEELKKQYPVKINEALMKKLPK